MTESTTLHAIIDPLCGWCYAAAPLLDEAKKHVSIQLHDGERHWWQGEVIAITLTA